MSFKAINMTKVGLDVVARIKKEIRKEFRDASTSPDFYFDVGTDTHGYGFAMVEHVDLMDTAIADLDKGTLAIIARSDPNVEVMSSGSSRPSFADFKWGAMPSIWVKFEITP